MFQSQQLTVRSVDYQHQPAPCFWEESCFSHKKGFSEKKKRIYFPQQSCSNRQKYIYKNLWLKPVCAYRFLFLHVLQAVDF